MDMPDGALLFTCRARTSNWLTISKVRIMRFSSRQEALHRLGPIP
jgi:hypothetical protein